MGVVELAALAWGFAEATLFFIVPDVLLTAVALRDPKRALLACVYALMGALTGGSVMYAWGSSAVDDALATLDLVPAISEAMLTRVAGQVDAHGAWAMFVGPLIGVPYKIYAVIAGAKGVSLPVFLAVSVPARLLRFGALTLLAAAIGRALKSRLSFRGRCLLLAGVWVAVYVAIFTLTPN